MISDQERFIFIHIPKSGGASISKALGGAYQSVDVHFDRLNNYLCSRYFMFAFVRNPWSRMVSQYFYRIVGIEKMPKWQEWIGQRPKPAFSQFVENIHKIYTEVYGENHPEQVHLLNQVDLNGNKDKFKYLNFIGRFENLQEDFYKVCDHIGRPRITLPVVNRTIHAPYWEFYDSKSRQIVADMWREDIEYFNYRFKG